MQLCEPLATKFVLHEQLGALIMDFVVIRFVLLHQLGAGNDGIVVNRSWLP